MNEKQKAESEVVGIIEAGLHRYKDMLETILVLQLEELYGGPKKFKTSVAGTEAAHEFATDIWNEAVTACIEKVMVKACPCAFCGRYIKEDIFECESCGKKVCEDCIIRRGADDNVTHICKGCIKGGE